MIRGTTPLLCFVLPLAAADLAEAILTLSQKGQEVLSKTMEEAEAEGNALRWRLTQAETLQLDAQAMTQIQLRVRARSGDALASRIITVRTGAILKEGEI